MVHALSDTSPSGCTRGVAWTFSPRSTYSEPGYGVVGAVEDSEPLAAVLRMTETAFARNSSTTATSSNVLPLKAPDARATGPLPVATLIAGEKLVLPSPRKRSIVLADSHATTKSGNPSELKFPWIRAPLVLRPW